MLEQVLKQLGLSDKEILVYLGVLKRGKVAPSKLAISTGLKRTTLYSVAKELVRMGLITEDLAGSKSILIANPPEDIKAFVEQEERRIVVKKRLASKAVDLARVYTESSNLPIPKITYISESDLNGYLYKRTNVWHQSILKCDGVWWGYQDKEFPFLYKDWIEWQWSDGYTPGVSLRLFSNEHDIEEDLNAYHLHKRVIKKCQTNYNFTGTTWICGDYLIMIVTTNTPHYLIEIHDVILAANTREVYRGLWEI